jgi:hypothetical protein
MSFKDDYAKFPQPSPERESFVYKAITSLPKEVILKSMKPVSVKRPDGATLTYKVMPDYIMIDGTRVPMAGNTAQRVANYFGLSLPSAAMVKEIYQNADVKVPAKPLSGSGTTVGGKPYSGKDVVDTGVGYAPFALNYNDKINQQLAEHGAKHDQIVSGFAKDIVAPAAPGKLGLYGLFDANGKPIQGGNGQTPHDTSIHSEYGSFVRLVSPDVEITYPDGKKETKSTKDVYQISSYIPKANDKPMTPVPPSSTPSAPSDKQIAQYTPEKPQPGRLSFLQRIDNFLSNLGEA